MARGHQVTVRHVEDVVGQAGGAILRYPSWRQGFREGLTQ
jgi:hypothetical protein